MLLLSNVDDITGELIPHAIDGLMSRGARSVHVVQAITKKGRMEFLFFVDAEAEHVEALADYMALELGTLGVRVFEPDHIKYTYQVCGVRLTAPAGSGAQTLLRIKQMLDRQGQVMSTKAELEDLRAALQEFEQSGVRMSLKQLKRLVEQVVQEKADRSLHGFEFEYLGGLESEKDSSPAG